MSESKKQTYISTMAIIISLLSLLTTIIMAINQYKEKIEVIVDNIYVSCVDKGIVSCDITVILANTSHNTTSLTDTKLYAAYSGFKGSEIIENASTLDMPITILQGGAERIKITCDYPLDVDAQNALAAGETLPVILKNQWISIRFYSAKGNMYSSNARFENAIQNY